MTIMMYEHDGINRLIDGHTYKWQPNRERYCRMNDFQSCLVNRNVASREDSLAFHVRLSSTNSKFLI